MLAVQIKLTLFLIAHLKPFKHRNFQPTLTDSFNLAKKLANIATLVETTLRHRILIIYYLMNTATLQIFEIIRATYLLWIRHLTLTLLRLRMVWGNPILRKVLGKPFSKTKWFSKHITFLNSHSRISAPKINSHIVHKAACWGMKNSKVNATLILPIKIKILLILQVLVRCFLGQPIRITQSIWIQ